VAVPAVLGDGVDAWFTGSRLDGVGDANLAHHRPHLPSRLADARERVARLSGTDVADWHLMRQVHGAEVGHIDAHTPRGAELRDVDVLVTDASDRPLVVLVADCLPILLAGRRTIAAVHAGWRGLVADAPGAAVRAMVGLGERPEDIRVVIGPGIGPCCYEVGADVSAAIAAIVPDACTTTRSGRPSVDLAAAAAGLLATAGVTRPVGRCATGPAELDRPTCTCCTPGLFSHRRDPGSGRQAGIIVRRGGGRRTSDEERAA